MMFIENTAVFYKVIMISEYHNIKCIGQHENDCVIGENFDIYLDHKFMYEI